MTSDIYVRDLHCSHNMSLEMTDIIMSRKIITKMIFSGNHSKQIILRILHSMLSVDHIRKNISRCSFSALCFYLTLIGACHCTSSIIIIIMFVYFSLWRVELRIHKNQPESNENIHGAPIRRAPAHQSFFHCYDGKYMLHKIILTCSLRGICVILQTKHLNLQTRLN